VGGRKADAGGRKTCLSVLMSDNVSETTDPSRPSNRWFQVSGFRFRISDFGFRISGFRLQGSGFGFRVKTFGFC
jgi:hypothetical protein